MSKHTKGPWLPHWLMGNGDTHWIVPADQPNAPLAKVDAFAPTDGDMELEGKANARLIAAAPDLLAALRDVIGWIPGGASEMWHTDAPSKAVERARAAIAKAEGK